jgi:2-polyprenyl-3-methyl-5-hydroxy-6-metoxy-1,4-benzoquinol methylase
VEIYDPLFAPDSSWKEKSYDAVTMVEVAEHLFEPLAQLRRVKMVLRPGGYLVLRTLLHYSDRERFNGWWYRKDSTHVCFYSPRSFEVAARLLELELVKIIEGRSVILRG